MIFQGTNDQVAKRSEEQLYNNYDATINNILSIQPETDIAIASPGDNESSGNPAYRSTITLFSLVFNTWVVLTKWLPRG